jgi:hypothetical protein
MTIPGKLPGHHGLTTRRTLRTPANGRTLRPTTRREMAVKSRPKLNRRSFLGQVAGGAISAGALGVVCGTARAQTGPYTGITDTDSGSYADNAGHGRGPGGNRFGQPQPQQPQTGYSDSDSGANADPSGAGRRGAPVQTGITDSDPTDPYGQGRGGGTARPGSAMRPDGSYAQYSGITDADSGATRDPANYGRGSRECRDADSQQPDWRYRDPVRRCE